MTDKPALMSREEIEESISGIERAREAAGAGQVMIATSELEMLCLTALEGLDIYDKAIEDAARACDEAITQRMDLMAEKIRSLKGTSNG